MNWFADLMDRATIEAVTCNVYGVAIGCVEGLRQERRDAEEQKRLLILEEIRKKEQAIVYASGG